MIAQTIEELTPLIGTPAGVPGARRVGRGVYAGDGRPSRRGRRGRARRPSGR